MRAAREAFAEWRLVPAPERGSILLRFAQLLERDKQELTELMSREMGKVLAEAGGDVQEAIDMSIYMAGEGRRLFGQTTPSELRDKFQMSVRMPIGVVGAITPWNFPVAIPAWKLAPALVCGNTIVFKPAEDTPLLAERFVELLAEAGLPVGVVNLVHGTGEEAGDALVRHPDVRVITFTGSRETGVLVTKNASDTLKHVHLELGGRNGIVVMDDADLDLAVDGIQDPLLHRHRRRRGRRSAHRRRARDRRRARTRPLLPADDLRGRRAGDAGGAGGDLRPHHVADPRRRL